MKPGGDGGDMCLQNEIDFEWHYTTEDRTLCLSVLSHGPPPQIDFNQHLNLGNQVGVFLF